MLCEPHSSLAQHGYLRRFNGGFAGPCGRTFFMKCIPLLGAAKVQRVLESGETAE
jgi:hypothetical protein